MSIAESKKWRAHVTTNLPVIDQEISTFDRKNAGMETKILTFSLPAGLEGHTCRYFWGDTVPTNTDYPDTVAPIGSCFCRLIVSGTGVVTGAELYVKNVAGTWSLYSAAAAVAAAATAAFTVAANQELVLADTSGGVFTVTLPPAAEATGRKITFKNVGTGTNALTIDGDAAETIDGATTNATMDAQFDTLTLQSDGSNWHIVASVLA